MRTIGAPTIALACSLAALCSLPACASLPPLLSGHCMEFLRLGRHQTTVAYIDRKQVGAHDAARMLLEDPTSAVNERHSNDYLRAGVISMYTGWPFAVASALAGGLTHHDTFGGIGFAAGVGLAMSGIGWLFASHWEHLRAVEHYNAHADVTEVCGEPPPVGRLEDPPGE